MKFPFKPTAIDMKSGGSVVEIQGIAHKLDRPNDGYSRDYWFYLATVKWGDTGKTSEPGRHLYPYDLCSDTKEGFDEINALSAAMMDYLRQHGEWCDRNSKHEGWYAHRKERSAA